MHLRQNKVPDYFHYLSGKINNTKPAYIFCRIILATAYIGVDKHRSVPEGNFQGWEL